MPSSMPRKITLLVVGMRLNTGAELVAVSETGVGVGCFGSPRPGMRSSGAAVVVVGGSVVVVAVVLVAGGCVVLVVAGVAEAVDVSPLSAGDWAAASSTSGVAAPLSSNGPAPNTSTSA